MSCREMNLTERSLRSIGRVGLAMAFMVAFSLTLIEGNAVGEEARSGSECVICHTDVKKLIRLGWQIEKIRPKPGKSAETSGEG